VEIDDEARACFMNCQKEFVHINWTD